MDHESLWRLFWQTGLPQAYCLCRLAKEKEREEEKEAQTRRTA
jgi:hypothetical protein